MCRVTTLCLVPMDLESDDEDKENGGEDAAITEETEEVDEKEKSHCMEELWEGGKWSCDDDNDDDDNDDRDDAGVKLPPEPRGECSRELQVCIVNARGRTFEHFKLRQK